MLKKLTLALFLVIFLCRFEKAQAIPVPPAPNNIPIVDQVSILSDEEKQTLSEKISRERSISGNQIAILIVDDLDGESIESYSYKVAKAWGIGTKENNNGVLLIIAIKDKQLRIEVGLGLEGALTDIRSSQIIRNEITPFFKQKQYFQGISKGLDSIILSIHGEYIATTNNDSYKSKTSLSDYLDIIFVGCFGAVWLISVLARSKSWWAGGAIGGAIGIVIGIIYGFMIIGFISIIIFVLFGLLLDWLVSRNYKKRKSIGEAPSWWAGGSYFGGSSSRGGGSRGGFGGFGGGGFGGGGASGGW